MKRSGKRILGAVLLTLGILCLLWFLAPGLSYGIWNIGNLTGIVVSLLLAAAGLLCSRERGLIKRLGRRGWGRWLLGILGTAAVIILLLTIAATGQMLHAAGQKPEGEPVMIVLGCKVNGERPSLMLQERLNAALDYLREHPETVCILSRGKGRGEAISEAECMYRYLTARGIPPERLYREEQSTSTRENLRYSLEILQREKLGNRAILCSNEFHQYRAARMARALGLEVSACSAATVWWLLPTFYVRELYAVVFEWAFHR